jgi:Trypsin
MATRPSLPCTGDSGGPIFSIDSSGEHVQMGVVSWGGSPCAAPGESGVYSRISTSRDFILSAICDQFASDASFCGQYNDGGNTGGGTGTGDEDDNENSDNSGKDDCGGTTSDGGASGLTSCSSTETYLLFEIKVDSFGSEVSWDLVDDSGSEIYSDSGFADGEMRSYEGCLSRVNSACYYLSIYDSYGDGMGYPYDGESAYIGVVFGQSSYLDNPTYTSQFTHELCHESA